MKVADCTCFKLGKMNVCVSYVFGSKGQGYSDVNHMSVPASENEDLHINNRWNWEPQTKLSFWFYCFLTYYISRRCIWSDQCSCLGWKTSHQCRTVFGWKSCQLWCDSGTRLWLILAGTSQRYQLICLL